MVADGETKLCDSFKCTKITWRKTKKAKRTKRVKLMKTVDWISLDSPMIYLNTSKESVNLNSGLANLVRITVF